MNNMKLLLFSVVFYIVWLFFFRSCVNFNEESFQKYMTFHQGTFIGLCENNYENLQPEAKEECDSYFEARTMQREEEQRQERKEAQNELSYETMF